MKRKNKKGVEEGLALGEIILLITSIVAFSYVLGSSFSVVSAVEVGAVEECVTVKGIEVKVSEIMAQIGTGKKYKTLWDWCLANGGSDICTGGSQNPQLKKHPCPTVPAPTEKTPGYLPSVVYLPGAITSWKEAYEKLTGKEVTKKVIEEKAAEKAAEEAGKKTAPTILQRYLGAKGNFGNTFITASVVGAAIAFITFIAVYKKTGDPARAGAAALRVGIGAGVGIGVYSGLVALNVLGPAGWLATGFVILGAWASKFLKREQDRKIDFTCKPWQAQSGGANCDSCNNKDFPCTEYQCKSLGTGCEIINKDTDEPRCVWKDPHDVGPPNITAWKDALTEGYKYVPLVGKYGVEIKHGDEECLPVFQPFTFGVELNKDGYCRIEFNRTSDFSAMRYDFGGENLYMKQHEQQMSFPGVVHLEREGINLTAGGEFEFYVRCEAATNGESNRDEFIFKFCIDKGPDTTSAEIREFNKVDGAPIAYFEEGETREVDIQVYVNEPAQCKWSHEDKSYENMENDLTCPNSLINFNAQLSYTCSGKLTGLENSRQNKFFFRCNDTFGNVNIQSKTLTLVGTQPLVISSVEPNATTIKNSTDEIKITLEAETSAGYKQGEAACYYSNTGASGSYILFSNTNSHTHSTNVWLGPGDYDFFIRCIDLAGNSDNKQISFRVETDTFAPVVVRVFHDGQNLKIITDEEATCVYDNRDCLYDFEDGIEMSSDGKMHSVAWDPDKNFYIKCQDEFGNQPAPQSCSIIARPFEVD